MLLGLPKAAIFSLGPVQRQDMIMKSEISRSLNPRYTHRLNNVVSLMRTPSVATVFIYRAYFSPLSRIPGPKLAAATGLYEFHYECCGRDKVCQRAGYM